MAQPTQYCTFTLDGLLFGVEVERVQEVLASQRMTKVPLAPAVVGGLVNQRGQIVTAIDLRKRLELPDRAESKEPMIIMIRTDNGVTGWLVDAIGDVVETACAEFEPAPSTLKGVGRELITGAFKLEKQLLLVLDTQRVMTHAEDGRKGRAASQAAGSLSAGSSL